MSRYPVAGARPTAVDKTIRHLLGFGSSLFVDALAQHQLFATQDAFAGGLGHLATVRTEKMSS